MSRWSALVAAIVLTVGIGGVSEFAQSLFSSTRSGSLHDLFFDLLGVAGGTVLLITFWAYGTKWFPLVVSFSVVVLVGSIVPVVRPLLHFVRLERQQADAFPLLGDFEEPWEKEVWHGEGVGGGPTRITVSSLHATRGKRSLEIEVDGSLWGGVRLGIGRKLVWPGLRTLKFDVYNSGDRFDLDVYVWGSDGRKYSSAVSIAPGANHCALGPSDLVSDAHAINDVSAFYAEHILFTTGGESATQTMFLDNVRVE